MDDGEEVNRKRALEEARKMLEEAKVESRSHQLAPEVTEISFPTMQCASRILENPHWEQFLTQLQF